MADSASPHGCEDIKGSHPSATPSATTPFTKNVVSTCNESEEPTNPTAGNNECSNDSTSSKKQPSHHEKQQQQRGKKPRPKRNRKRPRSQVHGSNDDLVIQSKVIPLTLNGQPIFKGILSSSSSSDMCKSDDAEPSAAAAAQRSFFVRVIEPYPYTFTSHAKSRWIGRTILNVYATEFGSYPESYYETAIRQGRILVSDELVDPSYCIRGNDVLCHRVHRHEPAILLHCNTAPYVTIVGETDTLLAVDKPGTLPIHPCGGYHENCLIKLLEPQYGKLYTIYRLDRLTSGVVIFAKSSAAAQVCNQALKERRQTCHKIYMARVKGQFPNNCPAHVPALAQVNTTSNKYDDSTTPCEKNHCLPIDGVLGGNTIENDNNDNVSVTMRRRNAFGYWLSNFTGKNVHSQKLSLQTFSTMEHTAEEWLQALDQKKEQRNDDNDSSCCTTTDLVWLDFACPVRISNPQIGVCVSSFPLLLCARKPYCCYFQP